LLQVASLSNFVFKAGIVAILGRGRLLGRIALVFGAALVAGVGVLWFWP
jgi:uncharacterized membrane protein (DUF4010 family)